MIVVSVGVVEFFVVVVVVGVDKGCVLGILGNVFMVCRDRVFLGFWICDGSWGEEKGVCGDV